QLRPATAAGQRNNQGGRQRQQQEYQEHMQFMSPEYQHACCHGWQQHPGQGGTRQTAACLQGDEAPCETQDPQRKAACRGPLVPDQDVSEDAQGQRSQQQLPQGGCPVLCVLAVEHRVLQVRLKSTLRQKVDGQKKSDLLHRLDQRLHVADIGLQGVATLAGDVVLGARHASLEEFPAADISRFLKLARVYAEVAVRGLQHGLEFVETQYGVCGKQTDDGQAAAFVQQSVEATFA